MAFIPCPECGYRVSDTATFCPHCGCNFDLYEYRQQQYEEEVAWAKFYARERRKKTIRRVVYALLIVALALAVCYLTRYLHP